MKFKTLLDELEADVKGHPEVDPVTTLDRFVRRRVPIQHQEEIKQKLYDHMLAKSLEKLRSRGTPTTPLFFGRIMGNKRQVWDIRELQLPVKDRP